MKYKLEALGTKRLKLKYHHPLSRPTFNSNTCRYIKASPRLWRLVESTLLEHACTGTPHMTTAVPGGSECLRITGPAQNLDIVRVVMESLLHPTMPSDIVFRMPVTGLPSRAFATLAAELEADEAFRVWLEVDQAAGTVHVLSLQRGCPHERMVRRLFRRSTGPTMLTDVESRKRVGASVK
jgi:hypothetical protein